MSIGLVVDHTVFLSLCRIIYLKSRLLFSTMAYPDPQAERYSEKYTCSRLSSYFITLTSGCSITNVVHSSMRGGHKNKETKSKASQSKSSRAVSPQTSKRLPIAMTSMQSLQHSSSQSGIPHSMSTTGNGVQDILSPTSFPPSTNQTRDYTYSLHSIASQFAHISYDYRQQQVSAQQCPYHASILDRRNYSQGQQLVSNDSDLLVSYLDPHRSAPYALFLDLDTEKLSTNKGCVCGAGGEENEG